VRKWATIFAAAGGLWMTVVLWVGSLPVARFSNFPGAFAARWVHYRGIGPSLTLVWAFNLWLVLTSAIEWVVVGLMLRGVLQRLSNRGRSQLA